MRDVKHRGFHKLPCEVCDRATWHYNDTCAEHSAWPCRPRVNVEAAVTFLGTLNKRVDARPPLVTPRLPPLKGGTRVWRRCRHVTQVPYKALCGRCMRFLRETDCKLCEGRVVPLPPCPCQSTYHLSKAGEIVTACEVCHVPTKPRDLTRVAIGRWGKVLRPFGHDVDGTPLYEERFVPLIKHVPGCPACAARYFEVVKVTPEGKTAFLRVRDL